MRQTLLCALVVGSWLALLISGCAGGSTAATPGGGPVAGADPRNGFAYPDAADYSALSWTDAFQAAHARFSCEYAFTNWKGVDWPGLSRRFRPLVAQAQSLGDEKVYYQALHAYVCAVPDRHVSLAAQNSAVPSALGQEFLGGGFGMAVAALDDGRVIAGAVVPKGPADRAGIVAGAEILTWGGVAVKTKIAAIDVGAVPYGALSGTLGNEKPEATLEHYQLEQARLLTRGPVGSSVAVVFANPGAASSKAATLTALNDGGQSFSLLNFAPQANLSDQVDSRILPQGDGYIRLRMEHDNEHPEGYPTRVYQQFQQAVQSFVTAGVPGVIVDARGNLGGSDELAADICSFFCAAPSFYEYQSYYDKRTGLFLPITVSDSGSVVDHVSMNPQTPGYTGSVVILVNPATHSSGEGLAMGIGRLPRGSVIGFHGTGGSFGMVGGTIALPGGYSIEYPFGRNLDQFGGIQLDSKHGIGGVPPNPRVPMTLENVLAFAAGTDVELQYAVNYLKAHGSHG